MQGGHLQFYRQDVAHLLPMQGMNLNSHNINNNKNGENKLE
jgi:hypothetical protein